MTGLPDAERAAILEDLARAARGRGAIPDAAGVSRRSPACGDDVTVRIAFDGDRITAIGWDGHGCVVSTAAASALAALAPIDVPDLRGIATRYLAALGPDATPAGLGDDLDVFAGIARFPLRAGCASLAWRAALGALDRSEGVGDE